MKYKLIDTNIILRLILGDHIEHKKQARHYFEEIQAGKYYGVITPIVLSECRYVMRSVYSINKDKISYMLKIVIDHPGMHIEESCECIKTLEILTTTGLDFADCYLLAKNKKKKYSGILTFDKKIQKIALS